MIIKRDHISSTRSTSTYKVTVSSGFIANGKSMQELSELIRPYNGGVIARLYSEDKIKKEKEYIVIIL